MKQFVSGGVDGLSSRDFYFLMTSLIVRSSVFYVFLFYVRQVPRPIALVSTLSRLNGVTSVNLAPFSFFTGVGSNPPSLVLSITSAGAGKTIKDTLLNVERDGQFVVNSSQEQFATGVNEASAELPYGQSELPRSGLTIVPSTMVEPPRVEQSAWALECELVLEKMFLFSFLIWVF
jgi:flavin reductase (DIM6/NTAB) family NADH-FMN oxidoreductase RutF